MPLNRRQQTFVNEYLIDLNATQAAIRAGYSKHTAKEQASRLLTIVDLQEAITKASDKREARTEITADRVLKELSRIAFFDQRKLYREDGTLKAMHEFDDESAAVVSGIEVVETAGGAALYTKKAKVSDKVAALGLAMRHLGMLNDKMEHSGFVNHGLKDIDPNQVKRALQEAMSSIDGT